MTTKSGSKVDVQVTETSRSDITTNEKATASGDEERQAQTSNPVFSSDWWIWELIGIVGSLAALIGLVILLNAVNGKKQPKWGGQQYCRGFKCHKTPEVSLNSVISLISTVAKICVLIPVTKGLGQLKWVYFAEKERVLADFETFESATRGLSGSALLVWRLRARHFAVLGAVAMILSLAFDPFIQNLVHYYSQYDIDNYLVAYITNATFYDVNITDSKSSNALAVKSAMSSNIEASVYNFDFHRPWQTPIYACVGNCTWTGITTMAVETLCSNLTDRIQLSCDNTTATSGCVASLPNGFSLGSDAAMSINLTAQPLIYSNFTNPIALIQSILVPDTTIANQSSPFSASECVLVPSVRSIDNNLFASGDYLTIAHQGFLGTSFNETFYNSSNEYTVSETGDIRFTTHPGFGISSNAYKILQQYLPTVLAGSVSSSPHYDGDYNYNNSAALQAIYNSAVTELFNCREIGNSYPLGCASVNAPDAVGCAADRVASAITKTMRDAVWVYANANVEKEFHQFGDLPIARGFGYSPYTYVRITWYWLALPVALWILSVIILLGTAWKTKRAGITVWRTSPLAMVFMGMDGSLNDQVKAAGMTEKQLSDKASGMQVRLRVDEHQPRFVDAV